MICPHCQVSLKYKERRGRRCQTCRRHFALEPRANALKLNDRAFQRLSEHLSPQGTLHYTPQQLCYALNRRLLARPARSPLAAGLGCGLQALVIGLATGLMAGFVSRQARFGLLVGLGVVASLFIAAWLRQRQQQRQRQQPTLRVSLSQCHTDFLTPWQRVYGQLPAGLITTPPLPLASEDQLATLQAILICPERAIRDCLRANGIPQRHRLALLPDCPPFTPRETALVAGLRDHPTLPLVLLHDASLAGCLLHTRVRQQLQLSDRQPLLDLGLHPASACRRPLLQLWQSPSVADKQALATATIRPPLSAVDRDWLAAGHYRPLLGLPPATLLRLVERGLARLPTVTAPPTADPAAAPAEQRARAVGFLSWPEAS